jgi:hypothetical protein
VGGVGFIARLRAADGSEVWSNEVQTSVRAVAADGDAIYVYGSEWRANVADGWLRKLDADGGELWTRTWGDGATTFGARSPAGGPEPAAQLCVLPDAGVVVAGSFVALGAMTAFDANDARALVPARGGADTFVAAFSADGDRRWVLGWGGPWNDGAAGVSVAPDGSLFIAGWFQGSAVMPDGKRIQGSGLEAIVVALAADGSYRGARTFGGPGDDTAYDIRVLPDGALALTGSFERSVDFGLQSEADVRTSAGASDAYLTQFRFRPELHTKAPDPVQRPSCKRDLDTLPASFEACLAMGGDAIAGPEDTTCFMQWCAPSAEFGKCRTLGGGISVSDGAVSRTCCKIVYPEAGCPCLGNACD